MSERNHGAFLVNYLAYIDMADTCSTCYASIIRCGKSETSSVAAWPAAAMAIIRDDYTTLYCSQPCASHDVFDTTRFTL